ncbi:response regulator transcription factor [Rhodococcus sp. D2-41]|uniref:Response regulator transcription factor n=1 Tax=Speluncibacter jeojiensis TaxID=2710754 RepID=A0A9X4M276_9ACTN|nr:response regulator transcription factor [Rhodococcus sp. D2-41]MDG3011754.1 response regulator transcription factor [Rhodococcus sp. D2-41]MDG3014892.1 response regulator transcription factor [Corynebacteriales bacterium D3-21]
MGADPGVKDSEPRDEGAVLRLVVADDQAVIREAVATMLDMMDDVEVVARAANGAEAIAAVERERPAVVLMDLRMPQVGGIEATRNITERFPDVAVLVLTTFDDEDSIVAALGAGARGYLTKDAGIDDIARAARSAAAGQSVLDPAVQLRLVAAARRGAPPAEPARSPSGPPVDLTAREAEVLGLIAEGLSNKDIAARLFIGEATVKTHINNLFAKARLRDRAHAVHYAFTHGMV